MCGDMANFLVLFFSPQAGSVYHRVLVQGVVMFVLLSINLVVAN